MNAAEYEVSAQAFEFCRIKAIRAHDFIEFLKKYPDAAMIATSFPGFVDLMNGLGARISAV